MRTSINAGHYHEVVGRQTTVDGSPPHSHAVPVASKATTINGQPPHQHQILADRNAPKGNRPKR